MKHPWEDNTRYYAYNKHERYAGSPQRIISEADRNRFVCPHCPRSLWCVTHVFVGKELSITKQPKCGVFAVRCAGYEGGNGPLSSVGWRAYPICTEFDAPIDCFEELP